VRDSPVPPTQSLLWTPAAWQRSTSGSSTSHRRTVVGLPLGRVEIGTRRALVTVLVAAAAAVALLGGTTAARYPGTELQRRRALFLMPVPVRRLARAPLPPSPGLRRRYRAQPGPAPRRRRRRPGRSRWPALNRRQAKLAIRYSQVRNELRPSNPAKPRQALSRRLLAGVLRIVQRAEHPVAVRGQLAPIPRHQLVERRRVAAAPWPAAPVRSGRRVRGVHRGEPSQDDGAFDVGEPEAGPDEGVMR